MDAIKNRFIKNQQSKTFKRIIKEFDLNNKKVLDLGCGYGEHLINYGIDSLGISTTQSEIEYGQRNHLNIIYGNVEQVDEIILDKDFEIIWANNFFEHILSPHSFLIKLKTVLEKDPVLILGVPVLPRFKFLLWFKKFKGALASSHINFFDKKILELTLEMAGWKIKKVKSFVFSNKFLDKIFTIFFSPHIYIVAENNKNFKYPIKKINEWKDDSQYKKLIDMVK